ERVAGYHLELLRLPRPIAWIDADAFFGGDLAEVSGEGGGLRSLVRLAGGERGDEFVEQQRLVDGGVQSGERNAVRLRGRRVAAVSLALLRKQRLDLALGDRHALRLRRVGDQVVADDLREARLDRGRAVGQLAGVGVGGLLGDRGGGVEGSHRDARVTDGSRGARMLGATSSNGQCQYSQCRDA